VAVEQPEAREAGDRGLVQRAVDPSERVRDADADEGDGLGRGLIGPCSASHVGGRRGFGGWRRRWSQDRRLDRHVAVAHAHPDARAAAGRLQEHAVGAQRDDADARPRFEVGGRSGGFLMVRLGRREGSGDAVDLRPDRSQPPGILLAPGGLAAGRSRAWPARPRRRAWSRAAARSWRSRPGRPPWRPAAARPRAAASAPRGRRRPGRGLPLGLQRRSRASAAVCGATSDRARSSVARGRPRRAATSNPRLTPGRQASRYVG
jgi:hypothetical protein